MAIRKVKTPNGEKWEVLVRTNGRESQRIRRKFERKVDAQKFLDDFLKKKNQLLEISSEFLILRKYYLNKKLSIGLLIQKVKYRPVTLNE